MCESPIRCNVIATLSFLIANLNKILHLLHLSDEFGLTIVFTRHTVNGYVFLSASSFRKENFNRFQHHVSLFISIYLYQMDT